jgi:hypothetical protein
MEYLCSENSSWLPCSTWNSGICVPGFQPIDPGSDLQFCVGTQDYIVSININYWRTLHAAVSILTYWIIRSNQRLIILALTTKMRKCNTAGDLNAFLKKSPRSKFNKSAQPHHAWSAAANYSCYSAHAVVFHIIIIFTQKAELGVRESEPLDAVHVSSRTDGCMRAAQGSF